MKTCSECPRGRVAVNHSDSDPVNWNNIVPESERSYQGIPDEDDDVININNNDEFTDTERDLIARVLGEKKEMDPYEEMNEKNDEPEERGTEFDGMDTPKYAFGEPSLEDLESEYKRLQAELDAQGIRRSGK